MDFEIGSAITSWYAFAAWYSSTPTGGQVPRDAPVGVACIAAVVWTAGFIYRGLPNARTTSDLIHAMHKLQFAYVAPLVVLLAAPFVIRSVAAVFFINYALLLVAYVLKSLYGHAPFMGIFEGHLVMIEKSNDRKWASHCLRYDLVPMGLIFFFPNTTAVTWLSLCLVFTGYQGLLSGLYADLQRHPDEKSQVADDDRTALAGAISALTTELRRRPNPPAVYLSIFGPKQP